MSRAGKNTRDDGLVKFKSLNPGDEFKAYGFSFRKLKNIDPSNDSLAMNTVYISGGWGGCMCYISDEAEVKPTLIMAILS